MKVSRALFLRPWYWLNWKAIDGDGNPTYQGIDQSKLVVPMLTKLHCKSKQ
jgi:hypothetical protein